MTASINRVRYVSFDFDTHVDDLRARLQVKFAAYYNDFALASLGMMLLDMISFGLDALSFYVDRRATEVYLETARTRRAVSRICRQLGYKMGGAVASSTDLTVSVTIAQTFTVPIEEGFQFQGPNDLIYEAAEQVEWSPAEQAAGTAKLVPVYEGETTSETFTSDGTANQVFELNRLADERYAAQGSVEVVVDGATWDESDFLTFDETDQFEVGYNDDPPTVRFGDGSAGNIPATNASIVVTYVSTSGKAGIVTKDTIQSVVSDLVVVGETVDLSINNAQGSSGGDDPETLEHAKSFAGRVFNSRRVAVTGEDYDALAGSYADPVYGRVAVAKALSSRSAATDLVLQDAILDITSALNGAVDDIRAEITTATTDTSGYLNLLLSYSSTITTALDNIVTSMGIIDANNTAVISGIRGNRNLTLDVDADVTQTKVETEDGRTAVDAIATHATTSQLTDADKTALKSYFDAVDVLQDEITSKMTTMRGAADAQVGAGGLITDEIDKVGLSKTALQLDGTDAYLKSLEDARAAGDVIIGFYDSTTPEDSTGLFRSYQYTLAAVADSIDPALSNNDAATVTLALETIDEHLDKILSADCKANLVTVPILTRDAAGFYAEPSNGLVNSLETYLTSKKEVTQTVEVVSGGKFLLFPIIAVRIGVLTGYSLQKVSTAVETVVDGILRDREFGVSLYISDVDTPIRAVEGVSFVNVTISGYTTLTITSTQTDKLDTDGNLIIDTSQVITKTPDSVTVSPEVVQSTS